MSSDHWSSPQACADACRAAGAVWDLGGFWDAKKLSSRDVVHLAAALADPTVLPPVACLLLLCFFFLFLISLFVLSHFESHYHGFLHRLYFFVFRDPYLVGESDAMCCL